MDYEVIAAPDTVRFVDEVLPSIMRNLGLERFSKSVLITTRKDVEAKGVTIDLPQINAFFVVIKSGMSADEFTCTLAHEMVHVKQFVSGILKLLPNGKFSWNGKTFKANTPYLDRPWEAQAFAKQNMLMMRAIQE